MRPINEQDLEPTTPHRRFTKIETEFEGFALTQCRERADPLDPYFAGCIARIDRSAASASLQPSACSSAKASRSDGCSARWSEAVHKHLCSRRQGPVACCACSNALRKEYSGKQQLCVDVPRIRSGGAGLSWQVSKRRQVRSVR